MEVAIIVAILTQVGGWITMLLSQRKIRDEVGSGHKTNLRDDLTEVVDGTNEVLSRLTGVEKRVTQVEERLTEVRDNV